MLPATISRPETFGGPQNFSGGRRAEACLIEALALRTARPDAYARVFAPAPVPSGVCRECLGAGEFWDGDPDRAPDVCRDCGGTGGKAIPEDARR